MTEKLKANDINYTMIIHYTTLYPAYSPPLPFQVSRLHSRNNSLNPSRAPSRQVSRTASPSPVSVAAAAAAAPTDDASLPLVLCSLLQREFSGCKSPRHGRKSKKFGGGCIGGEDDDRASHLLDDEAQGQSLCGQKHRYHKKSCTTKELF